MALTLLQQIEREQAKIKRAEAKIKDLQNTCPHNHERVPYGVTTRYPDYVKFKYGANTGNYDPTEDCSWTDYECTQCGKRWTEYRQR